MSQPLAWLFLRAVTRIEPDQKLEGRIEMSRSDLDFLHLPEGAEAVPEGILLECCAQSAGLSLILHREAVVFLPVLLRINESDFLSPLAFGEEAAVEANLLHRSDDAVEFECSIRALKDTRETMSCRLTLGLTPLAEIPDGGVAIQSHLIRLKRHILVS